jgi:2-dehydro-3-deoxygluconokinase
MKTIKTDVLCFGEILLRLSPPNRELILQSPQFNVCVGGAEANVAVALAHLGHNVAMASIVPDNALGAAATSELRRHGVHTNNVASTSDRMGLYFLTPGAGLRPSEIIYDRAHSAFAMAAEDAFDWTSLLNNVRYMHLSGITPALGTACAAQALAAVKAARTANVTVSFDGNYRAKLWQAWDSNPHTTLTSIIEHVDILFGNHRDISLLLGRNFSGEGGQRRRDAALAAFATFPNLRFIASTARNVENTDQHRITARLDSRDAQWTTEEILISSIVDRIGTGDAFASGVLHGLLSGNSEAEALQYGLALTCLKHSLPGDFSQFKQRHIEQFLSGVRELQR